MEVTIRNVNGVYWQEFKAEVVREGLNLGQAINFALMEWLRKKREKKVKSFFSASPVEFKGDDMKKLSEKVDEVLYA